jgi:nicotinamide-nucleotide amidase
MAYSEYLAGLLGQRLSSRNAIVATAESCTGGGIAQAITGVAGSSQWFTHGFVTYNNQAKTQLLGVPAKLIIEQGAVSQAVVEAMAVGAAKQAQSDYAVSVSGIAGPDGGSPEKPVGTVWIGWKLPENTVLSQLFVFEGDRNSIRNQTVEKALEELIKKIEENTV